MILLPDPSVGLMVCNRLRHTVKTTEKVWTHLAVVRIGLAVAIQVGTHLGLVDLGLRVSGQAGWDSGDEVVPEVLKEASEEWWAMVGHLGASEEELAMVGHLALAIKDFGWIV